MDDQEVRQKAIDFIQGKIDLSTDEARTIMKVIYETGVKLNAHFCALVKVKHDGLISNDKASLESVMDAVEYMQIHEEEYSWVYEVMKSSINLTAKPIVNG